MAKISDSLLVNASQPEMATVDGITVRKRSLMELIAADKYLRGVTLGVNPAGAITRVKLIQPGTV